jgi:hypothetical protein
LGIAVQNDGHQLCGMIEGRLTVSTLLSLVPFASFFTFQWAAQEILRNSSISSHNRLIWL